MENLSQIDLERIIDPYAKVVLSLYLNVMENQQKALVQSLRDEISKLKGEQPKPEFKPHKENINILSTDRIKKKKYIKKLEKYQLFR